MPTARYARHIRTNLALPRQRVSVPTPQHRLRVCVRVQAKFQMKLDRKGPPQPGEASRPPGTKPPRKPKRATELPSCGATAEDVSNSDASGGTPTQSKKRPRPEANDDDGPGREVATVAITDAKTMLATLDTRQLAGILRGLEAGVGLADLAAEARRRLAAGGGDAAGAAEAKVGEKKKSKQEKSRKKKKKKKSERAQ